MKHTPLSKFSPFKIQTMKELLSMLLCLPFFGLTAQTADQFIISAQGDEAKGKSMTMSWTIGDIATETVGFDQMVFTQGFQQPSIMVKEIDLATALDPKTGNAGLTENQVPFGSES